MERRDFYDHETYESLLERLERLTPETGPRWGKMNSAQMCAHCSEVAEVLFGALTADEHGWLTYKHLDHHLTQFGI